VKIVPWVNKTITPKPNGRSSDFISASYIWGCNGGCKNYCYVYRNQKQTVNVATNLDQIEAAATKLANKLPLHKPPNQISQNGLYYLDIGCNSDVALYSKRIELERILKFYDNNLKLNTTFATKYSKLLTLDVNHFNKKPRVRVSLMPERLATVLESGCTSVPERITDIKRLQSLGWEVQINFSPVVLYNNWQRDYNELFKIIANQDIDVPCEVIMLTGSVAPNIPEFEHNYLLSNEFQEEKITKYGSKAKRYNYHMKKGAIENFKTIYSKYWDVKNIRYIF
jgi:spore photoproduct lyase